MTTSLIHIHVGVEYHCLEVQEDPRSTKDTEMNISQLFVAKGKGDLTIHPRRPSSCYAYTLWSPSYHLLLFSLPPVLCSLPLLHFDFNEIDGSKTKWRGSTG